MSFRKSLDISVLHDKSVVRNVTLSTGTVFPLADISETIQNYEKLFGKYPDAGFFVLPLPYGSRENPKKSYYVTRNDTTISGRLLENEEIMWAAAKDVYDFHGMKASPYRLFWRILGFRNEYEQERDKYNDDIRTAVNQQIIDLNLNLKELSRVANRLPKQWTKVNMRIGNHVRRRLGASSISVVGDQLSLRNYYPTREEAFTAGWIQARE